MIWNGETETKTVCSVQSGGLPFATFQSMNIEQKGRKEPETEFMLWEKGLSTGIFYRTVLINLSIPAETEFEQIEWFGNCNLLAKHEVWAQNEKKRKEHNSYYSLTP